MSDICESCGQPKPGKSEVLQIGNFELNQSYKGAKVGDQVVMLTPTEFRMARALVKHNGHPCTNDMMLDEMYWDKYQSEPGEKIIAVYIFKLRKKLAPLGIEIRSMRCKGYVLVVPERVAA